MAEATASHGKNWYWAFFVNKMAQGASSALIPLFVIKVLGGHVVEVTLAAVAASASTIPAYLIWGAYVDRTGKRRLPLVWGMAITALAYLVMTFASDIWTFVGANLLAGFFLAATVPTSTILILEHTRKESWGSEVGKFTKLNGIGYVLGLIVGAAYFAVVPGHLGTVLAMRLFMGVCAAIFVLAWLMTVVWVREPLYKFDHRSFAKDVLHLPAKYIERNNYMPSQFLSRPGEIRKARRHGPGWGLQLDLYLVASFTVFVGFLVFYTPFPVMLADELALNDSQIFAVYLTSSIMAAALYGWAGREVDRIGNKRAQLSAWVARVFIFGAFALALLLMARGDHVAAFVLAAALNGAAGAMYAILSVAGTTTVTKLAPSSIQGAALGAYNAVVGVGIVVGGVLGGVIAGAFGWYAVVGVTSALIAVASLILWRLKVR
jgi:MFS family permease